MTLDRATLQAMAAEAGFDLVGVTTAEPFVEAEQVALVRLRQGLMGQLPWYHEARVRRGCHPRAILPTARSVIAVACTYSQGAPAGPCDRQLVGRVARYAWGHDYHQVMKKRLRAFVRRLEQAAGGPVQCKVYVDDGPVQDREVARRAGVGWYGKNTNILTPSGSWVLLGEVITDLELEPDRPVLKNCGECTACLDACPTGAIVQPYVLDSNRCISYLTIEHRGPVPPDLRPFMGDWAFGCDVCQEVCPVNRGAAQTRLPEFAPQNTCLDLLEVLGMTEEEFQVRFQGSPIRRAKRVGLQRNACIALGNIRDPHAVPALDRALAEGEPLVRAHATWALGRIGGQQALEALNRARLREHDATVQKEIAQALEQARGAAAPSVASAEAL